MASERGSSATRWAGVSPADRRSERRSLLVGAAFALFGTGGEAAVSVRAVCREARLHARYFYENFADTGELLGAVYDGVAAELGERLSAALAEAGDDPGARVGVGIHEVLEFGSADPRRGRVLFTEGRAHPVLIARRRATQGALMDAVLQQNAQTRPETDPRRAVVGAAMFTGSMVELAHQWLSGALGDPDDPDDLAAVVEYAASLVRHGHLRC